MKRLLSVLTIALAITMCVVAQEPLTQYYLVEVNDVGTAHLRSKEETARLLRKLGFNVTTYPEKEDFDDSEPYTYLEASRQGNDGVTHVTCKLNEDIYCYINFASQAEVDAFVDSMLKSDYGQDGVVFLHPGNGNGYGGIWVRVEGLKVKMMDPWEGFPGEIYMPID